VAGLARGHQFDVLVEIADGCLEVAELEINAAALVIGVGLPGIERQLLIQIGQGFLERTGRRWRRGDLLPGQENQKDGDKVTGFHFRPPICIISLI
jgi:hypothetical protein